MIKKLLIASFALSLMLLTSTNYYASAKECEVKKTTTTEEAVMPTYTINITERLVDEQYFPVKLEEPVDLIINNRSRQDAIFRVPMLNITTEVPKNSSRTVSLDFKNVIDQFVWFQVSQNSSNNRQGVFEVTDLPENIAIMRPESSDTDLSDIINYKKVTYTESLEDKYSSKPEPAPAHKVQTGGYVKGYW